MADGDKNDPQLTREIATIGSDPNRWFFGDKIRPEDTVLRTRGRARSFELYDDLKRDAKVGHVLRKRKAALLGREWSVTPGDDTPGAAQAADLVQRALAGCGFSAAVGKMLDALLKGVSFGEVVWQVRGAEILPKAILARDPRRFDFREVEGENGAAIELRLLTKAAPLDGVALPPRKFIVHRYGDVYENPWGLGLGHQLFWPVFFKRQGVGFWLSGLEKFAQPTVLGRYPAGTQSAEINKLLQALQAVASEAAVAVPEGMAAELLEAKRAGTFDTYESLARYMDEEIILIVQGETLTSTVSSSGGSRALGEVHDGVRLELTKADADELSDTLNDSLVRWIVELNMPAYAGPLPRIWWDVTQPEDLAARAKRDVDITSLGYEPTEEYILETYGPGWRRKAPAPTAGDAVQALFAEAQAARGQQTMPPADDPRDAADILTEQLGPMTADAIEPLLAQIRAVLTGADSAQAAIDGLVALYPRLDAEPLALLLGQALATADLQGRVDMQEGKGDA